MSLPRFLERILDAAAPALGGMDRGAVRERLEQTTVRLTVGSHVGRGTGRDGALLAANLLARLYPRLVLGGPSDLVIAMSQEIHGINPDAEVLDDPDAAPDAPGMRYETEPSDAGPQVAARGWNVFVDSAPQSGEPASAPAALAAAALGVGELFRSVFAAELGARGRRRAQPGGFNLVTLGAPQAGLLVPDEIVVPRFRLVGAGAIGQAASHTLALGGVRGSMMAFDPETVSLSNLQRYVLTVDSDVERSKVELLAERLSGSGLTVDPVPQEWAATFASEPLPTLAALDSPEARLALQASLPGCLYNAWTQPADVGWSRHERFGDEPCLACLYWPDRERPGRHEQIAEAFRQHPLRVLAYLIHRLPIGLPLPPGSVPELPGQPVPPEAALWVQQPLISDLAQAAGVNEAELSAWRERTLADVYQDGICGGALLHLDVGEAPREVVVPLAHQSALAGVMLAVQLIAAHVPELRSVRSASVEARFDVLAGLPQVLARPRARTDGCLCRDSVYRAVYVEKLRSQAEAQ